MNKCVWMLTMLLVALAGYGQKKWTGTAGNGTWEDPLNWEGGILPGADDEVLLDNSYYPFSYIIRLPDFPVKVRAVNISAAGMNTIMLELPVSNLIASPSSSLQERAFTTIGSGYTLSIGKGGVFINASGSGSGYSLRINDSIRILNGGKYVHRTRTGHAELVQQLSRSVGTESGVFRFENTDGSSIISISGRVFGTLELSAAGSATGGTSYMAAGTSKVLVRGGFTVEKGVNLSLNFSDTIRISGNVMLINAILNLANGSRSSCLLLEGDLLQQEGTIFESSPLQMTGTIIAGGRKSQVINCTGILKDSIILVIDNETGVELENTIEVPFLLHLRKGRLIAPAGKRIVIGRNAGIRVDTTGDASFIEGKVTKLGSQSVNFLFPVGKSGRLRWMSLHGATGDISVEYFRESAYAAGDVIGPGLDHISTTEFWKVEGMESADFTAEISFGNNASGGVSDFGTLRVAAFTGAQWTDAGNDSISGSLARGSIRSTSLTAIAANPFFLTLASSSAITNLLPVLLDKQWMTKNGGQWFLNWNKSDVSNVERFSLEYAGDGITYRSIAVIPATQGENLYRQAIPAMYSSGFCRIRIHFTSGRYEIAPELRFGSNDQKNKWAISHIPGDMWLSIRAEREQDVVLSLTDRMGATIVQQKIRLTAGHHRYPLRSLQILPGIYFLTVMDLQGRRMTSTLIF